jgi:hypothetical protein
MRSLLPQLLACCAGRLCLKCINGFTTAGPGSSSSEDCKFAEAGFQLVSTAAAAAAAVAVVLLLL